MERARKIKEPQGWPCAIGAFKNPHSQRKVTINDLREAQRQVLEASHLLYIVDAAKSAPIDVAMTGGLFDD